MFNILLASCKNIGPFTGKDIFVNYKDGKYLIRSPIGKGKSFLFFDVPLFGLYKYSNRVIINKNSKKGQIQLLFELEDRYYLVVRDVTQTKSGRDSTKTRLFNVHDSVKLKDLLTRCQSEEILQQGKDLMSVLADIEMDEITGDFKNDAELQNNLNDLLPAREIVLSAFFLLQDADNIFGVVPSERIQILKKLFGLIGIDEAKEVIADKKKELVGQLKAKEDLSIATDKVNNLVKDMTKLLKLTDIGDNKLEESFSYISDEQLSLDVEKLSKINIDLSGKKMEFEKQKEEINTIRERIKMFEIQKKNKSDKVTEIKQEIEVNESGIKSVRGQIEEFDEETESKLKRENVEFVDKKNEIVGKYENIQQDYDGVKQLESGIENSKKVCEQIKNVTNKLKNDQQNLEVKKSELTKKLESLKQLDFSVFEKQKLELIKEKEGIGQSIDLNSMQVLEFERPSNVYEVDVFLSKVIETGKSLGVTINETEQEIVKLSERTKKLKDNIISKEDQLKALEQKSEKFFCNKIETDCPFVEKIKGGIEGQQKNGLKADISDLQLELKDVSRETQNYNDKKTGLEKEKAILTKFWQSIDGSSMQKLLKRYQEIDKQIADIDKQFVNMKSEQDKISKIREEIGNIDGQIQQVSDQIKSEGGKLAEQKLQIEKYEKKWQEDDAEKILEDYCVLKDIEKSLFDINNKLLEFEKHKKQIEEFKLKVQNLETKNQGFENQVVVLEKEILDISNDVKQTQDRLNGMNIDGLKTAEQNLYDLEKNIALYNNIVEEVTKNKLQTVSLRKEIERLKNLYDLFSKELVIIVFMDYIKQLEEILNSILEKAVDFQLHFGIDEKGENLEINVLDEKGERQVQSLSGGQKNVLRIAWILSVSILQNAKLLFLDETINNLDSETIGKVSQIIKDFLDKNNLKVYLITHSLVLQGLDIWDEIVEV